MRQPTTALDIARHLIRIDTINPPGNEAACIEYLRGLLAEAGIECKLLGRVPERPNLLARLPGQRHDETLLIHGHVDVVGTAGQVWAYPPLEARLADGYLWGRGALDMKGSVAAMVAAILRLAAEGTQPACDVLLAVLADEETGSDDGAGWLVREHPSEFAGVRFAVGEGGGRSFSFAGRRFYPIAIAEKRVCWMRGTVRGRAGHGSTPLAGAAMAKLGTVLQSIDQRPFPLHVVEPASMMIEAMAAVVPQDLAGNLRGLLDPEQSDAALRRLPARAAALSALLRNTVSVTMLTASDKVNVIPAEISLGLDGRLLPGFTAADMLAELHAVTGDALEVEVVRNEASEARLDMTLFQLFETVIQDLDPEGISIPSMLAGFTDGCQFSKLGIQNYGFLPLTMPDGVDLDVTVHGPDERIPVAALDASVTAMADVLTRFNPPPDVHATGTSATS